MKLRAKIAAFLILASLAAYGQKLDLSSLDGLAARAKKTEDVNLDADKLKLAAPFLFKESGDKATEDILSRVTGVFVRTFEFDTPIASNLPELQPIRKQLAGNGWSKIVDVRDKAQNEDTQVYIFSKGGSMGGITVLSVEGKELTVVNVAGAIGFEELQKLKGMGIRGAPSAPPPPPAPAAPRKNE